MEANNASEEPANMYWIIDHEELCWAPGKLVKVKDGDIVVQCIIGKPEYYSMEKASAEEVHPSSLEGLPDLLSLGVFNEGALLHSVRTRYERHQIYTSIGTPILLSVNPYQKLKIFTTSVARKYRDYSRSIRSGGSLDQRPEPHLFMVAEESYQDMLIDNKNQSIIISGESGAGKTEATKIILCYLAKANTNFVSNVDEDMLDQRKYLVGENNIEKQVLDSNPLLEAFGNAKTFKNNNSSRFGKFIQVNFERSGKIHSASIVQYLLEKSRIVFQQGVERNFHIFYQLADSPEYSVKYKMEAIENYHYLNQSGTYRVAGVDDGEDFRITIQCMKNIGFTEQEIKEVLDIVVSILNLGNLEFDVLTKSASGDQAQLSKNSQTYLENVARYLQLSPAQLLGSLTTKIQTIGKDVIQTQLSQAEAYNARDGMAKAIYGRLFKWIVLRINQSISKNMNAKQGQNLKFIGLLDIFGFEIFKENSFEQMCINYANEKLQQHFNQHMFHLEQAEYSKENIEWKQIPFVDNQLTIDLIENPAKPSLFKLLDEECMKKGTGNDKNLLKNYNNMLQGNKSFKRPNKFDPSSFLIVHYAGAVEYEIAGFLEKNTDTVSDITNDTLMLSKSKLISLLFQKDAAEQAAAQSKPSGFGQVKAPQGGGLKGNTLSNQFRTQLNELILTLKESSPRYIRCIKPNSNFSPTEFNSIDVCAQLKCAGMLEAIRIRKAGYAIRTTQEDFAKRYRAIIGTKKKLDAPIRQVCEMIMKEVLSYSQFRKIMDPSLKKWQIGVSKVFMKEDVRTTLEQAMSVAVLGQAKHIQRLWKGFKARKQYKKMKVSMKLIKYHISRFAKRRRFRKVVMAVIKRMKTALIKLQRVARWRHRRRMIFKNVAIRIEKKKIEAERKRKEEELRKKKEEEMRLKKEEDLRQKEIQKQQQQQQQQPQQISQSQSQNKQTSQQSSNNINRDSSARISQNMGSGLTDQSFQLQDRMGSEYSMVNETMVDDISMQIDNAGLPNIPSGRPPASNASQDQQQQQQQQQQQKDRPNRFQHNMNRLEQFVYSDTVEAQKIKELEEELKQKNQENVEMKAQINQLRLTIEEKDREIKKQNIRLDARLKFGKEMEQQDFPKFDSSFATTMLDDRMSSFPRSTSMNGGQSTISSEVEKMVESMEEEIHQLKIKNDGLLHELTLKEDTIGSVNEECDELKQKSKKWREKLDEEIEKNQHNVATLTKQIKDLQEKNYKLEIELRAQSSEFEKKQYKDQSSKLEEMQQQLREKTDIIDELDMAKMNLEEQMVADRQKMDAQLQEIKQQYVHLNDRYEQRKQELDQLEEQLVLKEEMAKQYEEANIDLSEKVKIMQEKLEEYGEDKTFYQENFVNERSQNSQKVGKLKEVQRELERLQTFDKVRQAEVTNLKQAQDKAKKKMKELEEENEQMHEKLHQLKKQKAELENQLLLGQGGSDGRSGAGANSGASNDYEKQKLKEKVEVYEQKLAKRKQELKRMDIENQFYHQTISVLLTIKKVIEKEKQYCFKFATEQHDPVMKQQLMEAISMCRQKSLQLDQKLKQVIVKSKRQQEALQSNASNGGTQ